jgi:anti-anti-sigma factor
MSAYVSDATISIEGGGASFVLRFAGEFDLESSALIDGAADKIEGAHAVVVDFTEVTSFDSAALAALLRLRERLSNPVGLVLYGPSPRVRRVFEAAGVDGRLAIADAA